MAFRLTRKLWDRIRPSVLGLAALALCLGAFDVPAARAQAFNPFGWFQQVFRPQQHNYDEYRPQRPHPHYTYHPRPTAKVQKTPTVPPSFFVAVLGDLLGELLGQALTTSLSDRPEVEAADAKEDSGLVRDDYYDWPKAAHDPDLHPGKIVIENYKVHILSHANVPDLFGLSFPDKVRRVRGNVFPVNFPDNFGTGGIRKKDQLIKIFIDSPTLAVFKIYPDYKRPILDIIRIIQFYLLHLVFLI